MDVIVFIGIQGSGKGTQAKVFAERLSFTHINIGELFRKNIKENTAIGESVKSIIQNGELVSDDLVFEVIRSTITGKCKGLIFDGFPRTLAQAEYLLNHFDLMRVYYLQITEMEAVSRISTRLLCTNCGTNFNTISNLPLVDGVCDVCGSQLVTRPDDNPAAIHKRFREFYKETYPLKKFFEERNLLTEIDANDSIDIVTSSIQSHMENASGK